MAFLFLRRRRTRCMRALAIETERLGRIYKPRKNNKDEAKERVALSDVTLTRAARGAVRPARPERRRQDDAHQDPHDAARAVVRLGVRRGLRRAPRAAVRAPVHQHGLRRRGVGLRAADGARKPVDVRAVLRAELRGREPAHRRAARHREDVRSHAHQVVAAVDRAAGRR